MQMEVNMQTGCKRSGSSFYKSMALDTSMSIRPEGARSQAVQMDMKRRARRKATPTLCKH